MNWDRLWDRFWNEKISIELHPWKGVVSAVSRAQMSSRESGDRGAREGGVDAAAPAAAIARLEEDCSER